MTTMNGTNLELRTRMRAAALETVDELVAQYRAHLLEDVEHVLATVGSAPVAAGAPPKSRNGATKDVLGQIKLAGTDGIRSEELRASTGLTRAKLQRQVKQLLEERKIKKTGIKRATKYIAR